MSDREPDIPLPVINGSNSGPAPFQWDAWYASVGGRSIAIDEVDAIKDRIFHGQFKRFEGTVSPNRTDFDSPTTASEHVKGLAREFGADLVGIARVEPSDIYRGKMAEEPYAIVVGQKMLYEAFTTVPSEAAAVECMRIYETLGEVVIQLADALRNMGWQATVEHPVGDSRVMHIPLALKAGFGELGRHGSIINPELGHLFRIGSVLTTLPLDVDAPIDAGIGAFCDKCQACRIFCPADAIPDERSPEAGKDPQGNDRYLIDTGKCFPYFAEQKYCSSCLAVCAFKHKEWARVTTGEVGPYPEVPFGEVPGPVDPDLEHAHKYPRIRRGAASPYHRS